MRDYVAWHQAYDDPASPLSARLRVVQARLHDALGSLGPGPRRLVSLCAGEGRDVLPVLAAHPRGHDVHAVLVEIDDSLAKTAATTARDAGLERVEVRQLDAGRPGGYLDVLPADVLVLCGIFGNVVDGDVEATVAASASMVRAGGFVLWTRGASDPDLRPVIRGWFRDRGLREISFDGSAEPFGVGLNAVQRHSSSPLPERLFTFVR